MPIYEYLCKKCQHQYEKREGFDAPALQKCPNCGGRAQRMIHAAPIVFKGSGFYITDSRKSEADSQTKVDAKPDSKADSSAKKDGKSTEGSKPANEGKSTEGSKPANEGKSSKDTKPAPADSSAASS